MKRRTCAYLLAIVTFGVGFEAVAETWYCQSACNYRVVNSSGYLDRKSKNIYSVGENPPTAWDNLIKACETVVTEDHGGFAELLGTMAANCIKG